LAKRRRKTDFLVSKLFAIKLKEQHLHIICLDVPYPADYGGVFDLLYKIQALHAQGIKIHLHCFDYGRGRQPMLNNWCESIEYYERKTGWAGWSFTTPYIVNSRANEQLLHNLLANNYPILMEGIHCTAWLWDKRLANRKIMVRLHNVEHAYYRRLAKVEKNTLKKLYYFVEARLLHQYEQKVAKSTAQLLAVTEEDAAVYKNQLGAHNVSYLPVFLNYKTLRAKEGRGTYCLYHGNLSVAENAAVAKWLLTEVFNDLKIPFVVAGRNPSAELDELAHVKQHTCLVANPGDIEMQDMIHKAQVNILPSFNETGIKLKIVNALFNGRHCLVNAPAVKGSGLEPLCEIANDAASLKEKLKALFKEPFETEHVSQRASHLLHMFNNEKNAKLLIEQFVLELGV
jgi:hypothetical protein